MKAPIKGFMWSLLFGVIAFATWQWEMPMTATVSTFLSGMMCMAGVTDWCVYRLEKLRGE